MFVLNLLFSFNDPGGIFADLEGPGPLTRSKHWLKVTQQDPAGFDSENEAQYEDLGPLGSLFIPHGGNPHAIGVRIAPIPTIPLAGGATLDLAIAFGRPVIDVQRQPFASPFVDASGNNAVTMFVQQNMVRTTVVTGAEGWFLRLDRLFRHPNKPNLTHRYEFALGATVNLGGQIKQYGEDPEFDVGT
jgi:hypothetical protein